MSKGQILSSVAALVMGQSPPSTSYNGTGDGLPFYQGKTDFGSTYPTPRKYCTEPKKIAEPGDILMSVRAPVGATNLCKDQSCIGRGIAAIRAKNIDRDFLFFYLREIESYIDSLGSGAIFKAINKSQLRELPINKARIELPEQKKIAHILLTMQRAIEAQGRIIATTTELKKALMQKLFTKGLRGEPQKETEIGLVPESWDVVELGKLAKIERGKFSHRPRNEPRFYGGDYPFVQTGDVANCDGHVRTYTQTLNKDGLAISKMFPAGTILITIAANIGYTGILEFDSACPDSLIGITPFGQIRTEFLNYYLITQQPEMNRLAPRGTQKNINIQSLKPWLIVLPK